MIARTLQAPSAHSGNQVSYHQSNRPNIPVHPTHVAQEKRLLRRVSSQTQRRKVIVIPYAKCEKDIVKVMLVRDRRTGDYAFLSGGVKAHETIMRAAMRELREETYGALRESDIRTSPRIHQIAFTNTYRPQHKEEDIQIKKRLGEHFPHNISEACHVIAFELPSSRLEAILQSYQDAFERIIRSCKKMTSNYVETTELRFEDIRNVSKWERDQLRGRICSPDSNGIHLWDVHVKNGLAMRVMHALKCPDVSARDMIQSPARHSAPCVSYSPSYR